MLYKENRQNALMKALLANQINSSGIMPLNSAKTDRKLAILLSNSPEFDELNCTLRELRVLYEELCKEALKTQVRLQEKTQV